MSDFFQVNHGPIVGNFESSQVVFVNLRAYTSSPGDSVRFGVVKLCPTEMCHSQLWRPLLDYRWKTEGNNAPLEVFCSAKIVLFTTV